MDDNIIKVDEEQAAEPETENEISKILDIKV